MAVISAGQGCDYDSSSDDVTYVSEGAPFDGAGTVDYMGMYLRNYPSPITIKWSVYTASGNDLTTIDDPNVPVSKIVTPSPAGCYTASAPGDFTAFSVEAGNYLGGYSPENFARDPAGGTGLWSLSGDQTDVTGVTFSLDADGKDSLTGTGETSGTLYYQAAGGGAMAIAGSIATVKTGVQATGGASMVIAGTLGTVSTRYRDMGGHAMAITGTLGTVKTGFQAVGGYAMTIVGDCSPIAVIGQVVGQGVMAITGTLSTIKTGVISVGGGAVAIAGTLLKKTSTSVGGGAVSIVGTLLRKTSILVGEGSVISTGTLAAIFIAIQAVGQGTMSIIGSLETVKIPGGGGNGHEPHLHAKLSVGIGVEL